MARAQVKFDVEKIDPATGDISGRVKSVDVKDPTYIESLLKNQYRNLHFRLTGLYADRRRQRAEANATDEDILSLLRYAKELGDHLRSSFGLSATQLDQLNNGREGIDYARALPDDQ